MDRVTLAKELVGLAKELSQEREASSPHVTILKSIQSAAKDLRDAQRFFLHERIIMDPAALAAMVETAAKLEEDANSFIAGVEMQSDEERGER